MADFQEQLIKYRKQKQKRELLNNFKSKIKKFWMLGTGEDQVQGKCQTSIDIKPIKTVYAESSKVNETIDEYVSSSEDDQLSEENLNTNVGNESKCLKYTLWTVYFLFWVTLYVIAIELKFGMVFLMLSALFGIYFNTRTGPKKSNEISAYSIFNKNCESIDGTLKAEQFENEIRYGFGSVR
ncbi:uncharacterized protein Saysd1 [Drosophila virilis]|uniref:SAYSvFN domain-containing protein n=1 Tax=Drosophila virilis TaxID=7244 RepID=B4M5H5_DROVI|nr:uncharacterized protein LOC6632886 [Drosophila virilis]EDW58901.1 uncharacterized protein Dvir_GJ10578 [Drosophila virilis]